MSDEQDPLPLIALVGGKAQTPKRLGDAASASVALVLLVELRGAEGQVAVAGGGGDEGLALVDGYAEHLGDKWSSKPRLERCH